MKQIELDLERVHEKEWPPLIHKYIKHNHKQLEQDHINSLIERVWVTTEFPEIHIKHWDWLWKRYRPNHTITEPVRIYRGTGAFNKRAWSWTTDLDMAIWFAKRNFMFLEIALANTHPDIPAPAGQVLEGVMHPDGILFATDARDESEVVISGADHWIERPRVIQKTKEHPNGPGKGLAELLTKAKEKSKPT